MNKNKKLILCVTGMILGISILVGTIVLAKYKLGSNQNLKNDARQMQNFENRKQGTNENSGSEGQENNKRGNKMRSSNDTTQDSNNQSSEENDNVSSEPPMKPNEDMTEGDMTEGDMPEGGPANDSFRGKMNENGNVDKDMKFIAKDDVPKLSIWYVVSIACGSLLFSISLIYFIMDLVTKGAVFASGDKIIIFVLISVIVTAIISFGSVYLANNYVLTSSDVVQSKLEMNEMFNQEVMS